jgi:hypothetical protein
LSKPKILVAIVVAVIAVNAGYYWLRAVYRPVEVRLCEGIVRRSLILPATYSRIELSKTRKGESFNLAIKFDAASPAGAAAGGLATCEFNGEVDATYALPVITRVQIDGKDVLGLAILDDVIRRRIANSWY